MSIPATQLRPGMIIKTVTALRVRIRTPHLGNLRAFIQNSQTSAPAQHHFRSP